MTWSRSSAPPATNRCSSPGTGARAGRCRCRQRWAPAGQHGPVAPATRRRRPGRGHRPRRRRRNQARAGVIAMPPGPSTGSGRDARSRPRVGAPRHANERGADAVTGHRCPTTPTPNAVEPNAAATRSPTGGGVDVEADRRGFGAGRVPALDPDGETGPGPRPAVPVPRLHRRRRVLRPRPRPALAAGPTADTNLICLCRRHHRVKQRPGWTRHPRRRRHRHLDRPHRPGPHHRTPPTPSTCTVLGGARDTPDRPRPAPAVTRTAPARRPAQRPRVPPRTPRHAARTRATPPRRSRPAPTGHALARRPRPPPPHRPPPRPAPTSSTTTPGPTDANATPPSAPTPTAPVLT